MPLSRTITLLLGDLDNGREGAEEELVNLVYRELRTLAAVLLRREFGETTLTTTEMVHEAYLRLFDQTNASWKNRRHFFASAAIAMRRVLIDHARRRKAAKRIPLGATISIELAEEPSIAPGVDLLRLNDALTSLSRDHPRQAQVVELRYFAGLTETEVAALLEVSRQTVSRDWRCAKVWLRKEMRR